MMEQQWVLLSDVRVPFDADDNVIWEKATEKMKRAGISAPPLLFRLYKKSFDARKRPDITAVCSVLVAYARAAARMGREGMCGCKTVFDVPPAYLSSKSGEELRATLL